MPGDPAGPILGNFFAYTASPTPFLPPADELERTGYGFYATGKLAGLARLSVDEILEQEIAFVGTPEQVAEQIDGVRKIPGVTEFSLVANYGGLEHEKVLRTLELFARRVMPALS